MSQQPVGKKKMNYRESFRERFWMKLLGSPLVLGPFLLGCSSLMANWALEMHSGLAAFAGVSAILVSAGVFLTKFFTGSEEIGKDVATEMAEEMESSQREQLDELERSLKKDGDPRTEEALQDLRKLSEAFSRESLWPEGINTASRSDILQNVVGLFGSCVELLRKSLELWEVASEINVEQARQPIMQRREKMLEEVFEGLEKLGGVLAGLHEITEVRDGGEDRIRLLSQQLEESMRVAKAAETRMAGVEKEIEQRVRIN